jgi:hypothetical protein
MQPPAAGSPAVSAASKETPWQRPSSSSPAPARAGSPRRPGGVRRRLRGPRPPTRRVRLDPALPRTPRHQRPGHPDPRAATKRSSPVPWSWPRHCSAAERPAVRLPPPAPPQHGSRPPGLTPWGAARPGEPRRRRPGNGDRAGDGLMGEEFDAFGGDFDGVSGVVDEEEGGDEDELAVSGFGVAGPDEVDGDACSPRDLSGGPGRRGAPAHRIRRRSDASRPGPVTRRSAGGVGAGGRGPGPARSARPARSTAGSRWNRRTGVPALPVRRSGGRRGR